MGMFSSLGAKLDNAFTFFSRSKQPEIREASTGPSTGAIEEYNDWRFGGPEPAVRDFGMQSKSLREALEVLHENAPTLPGLNLFLDTCGFRSMNRSIRDMNEAVRLNLMLRCETVSVINPVAVRGMTIRTDLIVSEGFKLESTAKNEGNKKRVQAILDSHWELNHHEEEMFSRTMDFGVLGEQVARVPPLDRKIGNIETEPTSNLGIVRLGLVLPHMVRRIVLEPWNYEHLSTMYLQEVTYPGMEVITNRENMELKIINDERIDANDFGCIRGEVFYTSVNRRPGATRGLSDLAPIIDWLDIHDQMFFSDMERAEMLKRFIWDVTVKGASPTQCEKYLRKIKAGPPRPGTVRVHGENEIWDAVSPDLKVGDCNELRNALFLHCWGGMGLPKPWYVEGGDTNRATFSGGMTDPCFAWARTRKRLVSQRLLLEARFAVQVAAQCGRLGGIPAAELGVRVVSRDPDRRGYEGVGSSWKDVADSLNVLVQNHMLDTSSAANIVRVVLGNYGFEIDPALLEEELKSLKAATIEQNNQLQQQQQLQQQGQNPNQPPPVPTAQEQVNKPKKGIMGSSDPLNAIMNEAFPWLERAKKDNRELLQQY